MKKILSTILLGMVTLVAFASPYMSVRGSVVEARTGNPVPGAVVRIDKSYLWAVTDEKGGYSFDKVYTGTYDIEVECLGYVSVSRKTLIDKDIEGLDFTLAIESLALDEVVVTAEKSKDNINTTRSLGRSALNHLQATDLSNILSLLPGGKTVNPDLTTNTAISLRSGGTTAGNAAFGTAVEVDGVRVGDNADFKGMEGTGTRSISVENIESVEVVTGVPSAEYGDFNSGLIRVHTKRGHTPVQLSLSVNPRSWQGSVSKGMELGAGAGTLNLSGEYAKATAKLSSPYSSYIRRGFTFEYSNTFSKVLHLEAGITGNIGGMNDKADPDALADEYEKVSDNTFTPHLKLEWLLNRNWVTNISLEGSLFYHDKRSTDHNYYATASSQPAVHATEKGYFFADALPVEYYSDRITDSKELDYSASLKYDWLRKWNNVKNILKAGVQYKADGNVGKGEYYRNPALAADGYRPRPYSDYPYMHNLSLYIEDNVTVPVGRTTLNFSAGLRGETVFVKGSDYSNMRTLSPRLNARWTISDKLTLRGGWGLASKLPSFYILYPKQEYRDINTFGYSFGNSARYIYYTIPYTIQYNPDLKWQSNENAEIGVDFTLLNTKFSVVGYRNVTHNPYTFDNYYTPFSYDILSMPEGLVLDGSQQTHIDNGTGVVYFREGDGTYWTPTVVHTVDRSFVNSREQANGPEIVRAGVEFTADFPEIKAIKTSFRLDASYEWSRYVDTRLSAYYQNGWSHTSLPDRSYQYVGIYPGGRSVSNGKRTSRIDANLTSITHIPSARIVITVRLEAALMRHSQNLSSYKGKTWAFNVSEEGTKPTGGDIYGNNAYTAIYPVAYMDLDGKEHPFTEAEAANPEFSRLILKSGNAYLFPKDGYDPYFFVNLSVTKEIGNHVSFSFFANNFTQSRPYRKSYANGVRALFVPAFYYGLTCRLKF